MQNNNPSKSLIMRNILNQGVSYQINTWSSFSKEMTIEEVLLEIKSEKYKQQVTNLRNLLLNNKKEEYSIHKRTLPAVTFCGTFDGERKKSKLKKYNSFIVLDIDKLNQVELNRIKDCLKNEPYIFSYWLSPSNEGIKGLVSICYNFELNNELLDRAHKSAFQKLASYFKNKHEIELDYSGSDTTRLCFFSFDPAIVIKEELLQFEVNEGDLTPVILSRETNKIRELKLSSNRDTLYNPGNRNNPGDRHTIVAILKCLEKRELSITYSYEQWFKVAMAIANTFTYDIGEKYFLKFSSIDRTKYDEVNCKNFLRSCYESRSGAVKFNTIVYFAIEKGFITKKQRERGSEVVDESLSQVSSSKTVIHLPEDLKK